MKKLIYVIASVGVLLIVVGIIGASSNVNAFDNRYGFSGMFGNNNQFESIIKGDDEYRGMMGGYGNTIYSQSESNGEKLDVEILEENVHEYISRYTDDLDISDVFIYENSDYYFSIIESDTERGAMELLVNPYTGDVYPEYGPNMMWNTKYGMHYSSGQGMMGNRGMMGGRGMMNGYNDDYNYQSNDYNKDNKISSDEAYTKGSEYLIDKTSENLELSDSAHEFYGYFTFHVEEDGMTVGMLSVNGYTGEVWFHDWHGDLIEIIGGHEEDVN